MRLTSPAFADGATIPDEYAFCVPDATRHVVPGPNRNPALAWSGAPPATRSYVLLCVDTDVPSRPDDVNQVGRVVPASLPRTDFYHWSMIDIPAAVNGIAAGACSDGVTPRGKQDPPGPAGARQGRNDYTDWFAGDEQMSGDYHGYDGPCPPWNDALLHHYRFRLYALDVARLDLAVGFRGPDVERALQGHVLAECSLTGVYTLNPGLR